MLTLRSDVLVEEIEPECSLLNVTLRLGDKIETEDPCDECVCVTPPEMTCTRRTCPVDPLMNDPALVCRSVPVAGQCCPEVHCVPANPLTVTRCQVLAIS